MSFGKFFNYTDKIDMVGFNYHIKKKRFGISLHFTSYKHNMPSLFNSKPRQYGISYHLRFKKKNLKPYIHYTNTTLYNGNLPYELFSFGLMGNINNLVLNTSISAPSTDLLNLDNDLAQYNIYIGFLVN